MRPMAMHAGSFNGWIEHQRMCIECGVVLAGVFATFNHDATMCMLGHWTDGLEAHRLMGGLRALFATLATWGNWPLDISQTCRTLPGDNQSPALPDGI